MGYKGRVFICASVDVMTLSSNIGKAVRVSVALRHSVQTTLHIQDTSA